jgi:serine/threonine-protein kinase
VEETGNTIPDSQPRVVAAAATPPATRAPAPSWRRSILVAVAAIGVGLAAGAFGLQWLAPGEPPSDRRVIASSAEDDDSSEEGATARPEATAATSAPAPTPVTATLGPSPATAPERPPLVKKGRPPSTGLAPATDPRKTSAPAAAATAMIDVSSDPWANIFVDGKGTGRATPARGLIVAAGTIEVRLVNPVAGLAATRRVTLRAGEHHTIVETLTAAPR